MIGRHLTVLFLLPSLFWQHDSARQHDGARSTLLVTTLSDPEESVWDVGLVRQALGGYIAFWGERRQDTVTLTQNIRYSFISSEGSVEAGPLALTAFTSRPLVERPSSMTPDLEQFRACSDDNGNVYVVWTQSYYDISDQTVNEIVYSVSRDFGNTFARASNVTGNRFGILPRIACSNDGTVIIAFRDLTPSQGALLYRVSTDYGHVFASPRAFPTSSAMATAPDRSALKILPNGIVIAAWEAGHIDDSTYDIFASHSSDFGSTWSTPIDVSSNPEYSQDPVIEADESGHVIIAWTDSKSGLFAIYARVLDLNNWRMSRDMFRLSYRDPQNIAATAPAIVIENGMIWSTWCDSASPRYSFAKIKRARSVGLRYFGHVVDAWSGSVSSQLAASNDGSIGMIWIGCRVRLCGDEPFQAFLTVLN